MKPNKTLLVILMFIASITSSSIFSQSLEIALTEKSINQYLTDNDLKAGEIQIILLLENDGTLILSNGEALGIPQSNSKKVVVFIGNVKANINLFEALIDDKSKISIKKDTTNIVEYQTKIHLVYLNSNILIKL